MTANNSLSRAQRGGTTPWTVEVERRRMPKPRAGEGAAQAMRKRAVLELKFRSPSGWNIEIIGKNIAT